MKSIEDTVNEIREMIVREEDLLREHGASNHMGSQSIGALEVLRELECWILEL